MFLVFKHCSRKLMFFLLLPNQVNRIKNETGTSILIPSNNEHSNILRIEGSPKGVASAKEEIMQMVKKLVSFCRLVVKSLNGLCPQYLTNLLDYWKSARSLRSNVQDLLIQLTCKTKTYGDRAFSVCAPKV